MSSDPGDEPSSTAQSFTAFWMAGPGSPSTPIVGNPVANPVPTTDLGALGSNGGGVSSSGRGSLQQSDLTTMTNAVPHDDFSVGISASAAALGNVEGATLVTVPAGMTTAQQQQEALNEQTLVTVVDSTDGLLGHHSHAQQIHVRLTGNAVDQAHHHQQHQQQHHHLHQQQQQHQQQQHQQQQHQHQMHQQQQQQQQHQQQQDQQHQIEHKFYPIVNKTEIIGETVITGELIPSVPVAEGEEEEEEEEEEHSSSIVTTAAAPAASNGTVAQQGKKKAAGKNSSSVKVAQRRRLSASHREMIVDLVFNEKKTSREVARYMCLPQSTVMSVVQVFKKEHRIHKKTATGRKRRLTTEQEFQLFEMSQEHDNVSVDEIRTRFLQKHPHFQHISKTTIYRTLERGKKGLIGMEPPLDRYLEPVNRYVSTKKKTNAKGSDPTGVGSGGGRSGASAVVVTMVDDGAGGGLTTMINVAGGSRAANGVAGSDEVLVEPCISIMEDTLPINTAPDDKDAAVRHRRSLSIAEREMIISLFFNGNRTIREVADFMHLAKSTVSSVVQVFRRERRVQRKTSTGRKKKLSTAHEQRIMDILSEKDDITIEETRNKFLMLNPEVQNISKSTIYRIMENCQSKMKAHPDLEVFVGALVHATDAAPMAILKDMVIGVMNGKIEFVEGMEELNQLKAEYCFTDSNILYMNANQFLVPGFVDTHTHAPQFPNNGLALDLPLLEWLQTYTFPTEANFSDTVFAREVYTKVVDRLLRNGTTTAAYFATIHLEATKILADLVRSRGQRAIIGKVNMLRNCPEYYREASLEKSIAETEAFIRYVRDFQTPLVQPAITPRFAPTCHEDQMTALAELAAKYDCHIQTHLCECQAENSWVRELFPWAKSYTEVYDAMRLLGEKSIMAHVIWTTPADLNLLAERGTGIAHCPSSNLSLRSGHCDVRALLNRGLKVGLGTDCSGGYSPSLLDTLRRSVHVSNTLALEAAGAGGTAQEYNSLTHKEAFRLATLGGAKVLNMEDKIGNFEIDKEFDALLIDVAAPGSPLDLFSQDTLEMKVDKFLYNGDDRNIVRVYVAGRRVLDNTPTVAAAAAAATSTSTA